MDATRNVFLKLRGESPSAHPCVRGVLGGFLPAYRISRENGGGGDFDFRAYNNNFLFGKRGVNN